MGRIPCDDEYSTADDSDHMAQHSKRDELCRIQHQFGELVYADQFCVAADGTAGWRLADNKHRGRSGRRRTDANVSSVCISEHNTALRALKN